jgi:hypothetical protein
MSAYLYPTHPCGDNGKNWIITCIRDDWKASCLPYFSFPWLWTYPSELNTTLTPSGKPFWLYFYYSETTIRNECPDKIGLARQIEFRARVVEYDDVQTNPNPFAQPNVFVISIGDIADVKIWFKCDRFEEVRKANRLNNNVSSGQNSCLLTLADFEYAGTVYTNSVGLALQRVSPFRRLSPIVVVQTNWYEIQD